MNEQLPIRRVLIVSPSFPPTNTPDMQRVRMSLPYYHDNGWTPIVLAVDPSSHGGTREEALLSTVPDNISVHHCRAFPIKWTRWFGIGNLGLRSWLQLLVCGWQIIRREKIDLVFFSNTQFITFTLGRIWRFFHGVPYVIDLQDPWLTDYYQGSRKKDRPGGWKYGLARIQARLLEGWSFKRMSGLMSVSHSYIDDLQQRYRWFSKIPADVIGFGASQADLSAAAKTPGPAPDPGDQRLRLVYTGVAGPVMQPALTVLFDGMEEFRRDHPEANKLRLAFLGTSYAAAGTAGFSVSPVARQFAIDDLVSESPVRLGHLEALREQTAANALLLLGTDDPGYSPSKLYPYFLSGRPILAVVAKGSALEKLLHELSCAVVVTFESVGPDEQTRAQLTAFFEAMLTGFPPGSLPERNNALFQREFLVESLTRRQCALFDRALAEHFTIFERV